MSRSPIELTPEILRAETAALRGLAQALLGSAHDAEDVAQDAWLALLRRPPAQAHSRGPWLTRVAGNFARSLLRRHERRQRREAAAARGEELPSTAETVARIELLRRVADAVLDLAEPYRTTVLLRFWEGLPPRAIAARMHVPVATVRARVARALVHLREALDRACNGRTEWFTPFALWLAPGRVAGRVAMAGPALGIPGVLGVLLMKQVMIGAAACLVLAASAWWLLPRTSGGPGLAAPDTEATRMASQATPRADPLPTTRLVVPATLAAGGSAVDRPALANADEIRGRAVDETGAPVRGLDLAVFAQHLLLVRTQSDGSFCFRRTAADAGPVRIRLTSGPYAPVDWPTSCVWGTAELVLAVRRLPGVEVLVVEADTGRPVEDYALKCFAPGSGSTSPGETRVRHAGRHEGGRLFLTGVRGGENLLVVLPDDAGLMPNHPVAFDTTVDAPIRVRVELRRRLDLPVVVQSTAGVPVADCGLELVQGPEGSTAAGRTTLSLANAGNVLSTGQLAWLHDQATTDAQGRARLRGPATDGPLSIRVLGPHCVPRLVAGVRIQLDMPLLRIEVVAGATLCGRVFPARVLEQWPGKEPDQRPALLAVPHGVLSEGGAQRFARVPVASDGSYRIDGIPPGPTKVLLQWHDAEQFQRRVLQILPLADGEVRQQTLDASALIPVQLRGRAWLNGVPLAHGMLRFGWRVPGGREVWEGQIEDGFYGGASARPVATDAQGRYAVAVQAGENQATLDLGAQRWVHGDWFTLVPGADRELDLHFDHRTARVRVLDAEGRRPIASQEYRVQVDGWASVPRGTTDADGWAVLDPVPPFKFRLVTLPPELDTPEKRHAAIANARTTEAMRELELRLDWLEVPKGKREMEFMVRMPRGR